MKKSIIIAFAAVALVFAACTKEGRIDHLDSAAPAPPAVNNINVVPGPGSAAITYDVPNDPNLLYVKAVYEIRKGVFREAKTSFYMDTLHLEGFSETKAYDVKIYSVGKNEKESSPILTEVTPLKSPVQSAFESIKLSATFGGVRIDFENSAKANIIIGILIDTTGNKTWATVTDFYTAAEKGTFSVRGYDATEKRFAVVLKDRWSNRSDTLVKPIVPLFDELIDRNNIRPLVLPNDAVVLGPNNGVDKMFDGRKGTGVDPYGTTNASGFPQSFTFDFGEKVIISRFKSYHRPAPFTYGLSAVKKFEIWGSNNPNTDGSWDSWELLGQFESFKPSGLPFPRYTEEDVNYGAILGEDFEFDDLQPAYRYIRFKTLETWDMGGQVAVVELELWGLPTP